MPFRFMALLALSAVAFAQATPQTNPASGTSSAAPSQSTPQATANSTAKPANPEQKSASPAAQRERSGVDPLLDFPPLPKKPATLVGGTVARLDRIRDRMAVRPFGGGGSMNIVFDMRTKIYRDGQPGTIHDIKPGSRVYIDTMLNRDQIFARSIRVETQGTQGDARGQILAYDARRQLLTLREQVSPEPVRLRVGSQTTIQNNGKPGSLSDLEPGSIVLIRFEPGADNRDVAREIKVLATPGASFTFAGLVTYVDLRARRVALDNRTDGQNYDILMDSVPASMLRDLRVGSDAVIKAVFDGQNYQAHTIEVLPRSAQKETQQPH